MQDILLNFATGSCLVGSFFSNKTRNKQYFCIRDEGREKHMKFNWKSVTAAFAVTAMAVSVNVKITEAAMTNQKKAPQKIVQTAGRTQLGEFAPDFARYNDDILFGEVWSKNDVLPLHDRSIVTVSALVASGIIDSSLKYHIQSAKNNGVTKAEMAEIITQLGFYAGWPKAWAAFNMAKEVYAEPAKTSVDAAKVGSAATMTREAFQQEIMFPIGQPNDAYAKYFTGQSYLAPVSTRQVAMYNVTFEPSCRNNWHIHHAKSGGGQMLICVGGRGWYQEEGKPAVELLPGTVVNIPANVKHWHGAAANSWMSHLAIEVEGVDTGNEWCEPVTDAEYKKLK